MIGLPVATGISAVPSIIGPASALFRPQKSHSTGGCAGDELSSVVTLVTPDQRERNAKDRYCRRRHYGERLRFRRRVAPAS